MNEPVSKDQGCLKHLKIAIDAVPKRPEPLIPGQNSRRWLDDWSHYYQHATIAWQTAFEWREGWRSRCHDITPQSIQWSAHCDEGDEGMALIREKLQS